MSIQPRESNSKLFIFKVDPLFMKVIPCVTKYHISLLSATKDSMISQNFNT